MNRLPVLLIMTGALLSVSPVNAQSETVAESEVSAPSQGTTAPATPWATDNDNVWYFGISPYLWFAGTRGTVGAFGRDASVHASAGDLLSHINFGLMAAAEVRYNRFLLTNDLLWIRLSSSSALPFPDLGAVSADVRVGQFMWTPKLGFRVIKSEKLTADANVGARYWHLGQKLGFTPSLLGLNVTATQSWADIVVGGRVNVPLGQRLSVTVLGDVGGWNASAKLDYQFAGLVNFRIHPHWTLSAGYRYLYVDYANRTTLYDLTTSGGVIGATYHFK